MDPHAVEQREVEVCQRSAILVPDVTATPHAGRSATSDQNWKVLVVVNTGVAQPASVQVHRVIEQRAVAVGSGFQFLEKLRKQRYVERIDLGNLEKLFRIVAMMTRGMVRVRDADFRIRTVIELAGQLEGDDPCDVGLKRQDLQIEQELRVVGERRRDTNRPFQIGYGIFRRPRLGTLDLALDLATAVEVLIDANAIGYSHSPLEPRDIVVERIEQAAPAAQRRAPGGGGSAFAEEVLEHDARMRLRGKRCRR